MEPLKNLKTICDPSLGLDLSIYANETPIRLVTQSLSESQPRISGHTLYKLYTVQFGTYAFPSQFDTVGANSNYQRTAIFILKVRKLRNLFTHTTDFTNVKIFCIT
jgi:hypothetical protein